MCTRCSENDHVANLLSFCEYTQKLKFLFLYVCGIDVNGREFCAIAKFLREFYATIGRKSSGVLVFRKKNSRNKLPRKINS